MNLREFGLTSFFSPPVKLKDQIPHSRYMESFDFYLLRKLYLKVSGKGDRLAKIQVAVCACLSM